MSITKYQIFVRTAICGSFTKAAEQLGFTQSGVSHAIASLEDELGLQLMARGRGGVSLTAEVLSGVSVVDLALVGNGLAHILVAYAVNKAVGAHVGAFLIVAQL